MRNGVLAHFNADIAASHLVRHCRSRAGAEKGVEDEVAGVGGDVENCVELRRFRALGVSKMTPLQPKRSSLPPLGFAVLLYLPHLYACKPPTSDGRQALRSPLTRNIFNRGIPDPSPMDRTNSTTEFFKLWKRSRVVGQPTPSSLCGRSTQPSWINEFSYRCSQRIGLALRCPCRPSHRVLRWTDPKGLLRSLSVNLRYRLSVRSEGVGAYCGLNCPRFPVNASRKTEQIWSCA